MLTSVREPSSLVLLLVLTAGTSRVLKCSEGESGPTAPLAMRPLGWKSAPKMRRRAIALERNGAPLCTRSGCLRTLRGELTLKVGEKLRVLRSLTGRDGYIGDDRQMRG